LCRIVAKFRFHYCEDLIHPTVDERADARLLVEHLLNNPVPITEEEFEAGCILADKAQRARLYSTRSLAIVRCIKRDPHNVDMLLMLIDYADYRLDEMPWLLRRLVNIAELRLEPEVFRYLAPRFWDHPVARQYLTARYQLAVALRQADCLDDAIQEYQAILALNKQDQQGARYQLVALLLETGRCADAQRLFDAYPEDCERHPTFGWGLVLERLLAGDQATARTAMVKARHQNPFMVKFLRTGRRTRNQPKRYPPGSKEEAEIFSTPLIRAWTAHPDAWAWLKAHAKRVRLPRVPGQD
jgi:tetratricopeptide (TPR) repeat protein